MPVTTRSAATRAASGDGVSMSTLNDNVVVYYLGSDSDDADDERDDYDAISLQTLSPYDEPHPLSEPAYPRRRATIRRQYADGSLDPPKHTIDLSLPPEQRYVALTREYRECLSRLPPLFDEVAASNPLGIGPRTLARVARALLRRLHDAEQTAELRGIAEASGVEMWLLVAFNVLLDLFMGCTSGGARVRGRGAASRMVHFRTLDWGMDALRLVVVQLEFVERPGGPVIARSVTYVGFVGILTGVRQGLSVSLNFRAENNSTSRMSRALYLMHQLSVLLGGRPSIASQIRQMVVPPHPEKKMRGSQAPEHVPLPKYEDVRERLPSMPSCACYLTLSDGQETCIIEKDRLTGISRKSKSFISVTNHDVSKEGTTRMRQETGLPDVTGMQAVLDESYERRDELEKRYRAIRDAQRRKAGTPEEDVAIHLGDVEKLVLEYPTSNECTHFATIMDPTEGSISWLRWWREERDTSMLD